MKHRSWSYLILLVLLLCPILLVACDKDKDNNPTGKVPEYQGMVVSNSKTNSAMIGNNGNNGNHLNPGLNPGHHNGHVNNNKPQPDKDDPFGDNSQVEDKVSSLAIVGPIQSGYYTTVNHDIYITIKLTNPDQYEILSFTLNDKKYSSYMFESGSDMENLILKVNVGDVVGHKKYTIDAIKYVDGDSIKDVIMKGEKTISVGVTKNNMVVAQVSNEIVGLNNISFDVNLTDELGLIALSNGKTVAVLYDGDTIVDQTEIGLGNSHISFDGLKSNYIYQYAIVSGYDDYTGSASNNHTLYKNAVYTQSMIEFADVEITYNSVSWDYLWNDNVLESDKEIVLQELYLDQTKVKEFEGTSINQLYAAGKYTIKTTYKNLNNQLQYAYLQFTTQNIVVPTCDIAVEQTTSTSITFYIDISDPLELASFEFVLVNEDNEIVYAPMTVVTSHYLTIDIGLEQNTKYFGKVNYSYNSHTANGIVSETSMVEAYTLLENTPTVSIVNVVESDDSIFFEVNIVDELSVVSSFSVTTKSLNGFTKTINPDSDGIYEIDATNMYELRVEITYTESGITKRHMTKFGLDDLVGQTE